MRGARTLRAIWPAVLVLGAAAGGPVTPALGEVLPLTEPGTVGLAQSDRGEVLAIVHSGRSVRAFLRPSRGSFASGGVVIPRDGALGAYAMGPAGDAVLTWTVREEAFARDRRAGGAFGPARKLGSGRPLAATVDRRGDVVVVLTNRKNQTALQWRVGGRARTVQVLGRGLQLGSGSNALAADGFGNALVLATARSPSSGVLRAFVKRAGQRFGPAIDLVQLGRTGFAGSSTLDRRGLVRVAWMQDGRLRLGQAPLGEPITTSQVVGEADALGTLDMTTSKAGDGVVVWTATAPDSLDPERPLDVWAALVSRDGVPSTPRMLGRVRRDPFSAVWVSSFWPEPRAAINDSGDVAVAWRDFYDVYVSYRRPGEDFGPPRRAYAPRDGLRAGLAGDPGLTLGRDRIATLGWQRFEGERVTHLVRPFADGSPGAPTTISSERTYEQEAPRRTCFPPGLKTYLRTDRLIAGSGQWIGSIITSAGACLFARGVQESFDSPSFDEASPPPAMDAAGALVAFEHYDCTDPNNDCSLSVQVVDLRGALGVNRYIDPAEGVLVLQVTPSGGVAWSTCGGKPSKVVPGCGRPRGLARVYKVDIGARERQLLDAGVDIDPSSLRLTGSRLTWLNGGVRKVARLT